MDKHTREIFRQFFTTRHLIRTLVRLFYDGEIEIPVGDVENGQAKNPKSICDPACGTGDFLVESFKHLAANATGLDVLSLAKKSIQGFDIYAANGVRSRINMYLAQVNNSASSIVAEYDISRP
jgi:type I restriction enzyme M protein